MKRISCLLLCILVCLACTGCAKEDPKAIVVGEWVYSDTYFSKMQGLFGVSDQSSYEALREAFSKSTLKFNEDMTYFLDYGFTDADGISYENGVYEIDEDVIRLTREDGNVKEYTLNEKKELCDGRGMLDAVFKRK